VCFCRKSTDLSWEGDEPSAAVAEEVAPPVEEFAPASQAVPEPQATEALLPGAEAERSDIPAGVPMQKSTPGVPEAAGGAPEPMEEVVEEAAVAAGGEEVTTSPEVALEVAIHSPEIRYAEPIRSALMTEAAVSSRGGIELLAYDLVDLATVTRHLEVVRQAEQWMKVSSLGF
jgi:hypothetical protein